jgi:hypothetical protein
VRDLLQEADVPARSGAVVLLRFLVSKKEGQLERLRQRNKLEL